MDNLKSIAHHEAAHAVAALLFEFPIDRVSIEGDDNLAGHAIGDNPLALIADKSSAEFARKAGEFMVMLLAGYYAEQMVSNEPEARSGARQDIADAQSFAVMLAAENPPRPAKAFMRNACQGTASLVADWGDLIEELAGLLLICETVDGEDVAAIASKYDLADYRQTMR